VVVAGTARDHRNEGVMTITIHNDACMVEGILEDVNPDDVEQLRSELPLGWHIEEVDG
jgi:hypothetical protein